MKVMINVDWKAALDEGRDLYGPVVLVVPAADIPKYLRQYLEPVNRNLALQPRAVRGDHVYIQYPPVGQATKETLITLLEHARAEEQKALENKLEKEREEAAEQARLDNLAAQVSEVILKLTPEELADTEADLWISRDCSSTSVYTQSDRCPVPRQVTDLANNWDIERAFRLMGEGPKSRIASVCDLLAARSLAEKQASEREAKLAEERKTKQLDEIVQKLGNELQIRKWADGLMARREVIDLWERYRLSVLSGTGFCVVEGYVGKLEHEDHCEPCDHPTSEDIDLTKVSDDTYDRLLGLREYLPDAVCVPRRERLSCIHCGASTSTVYYRVTLVEQELTLDAQVVWVGHTD